MNAHPLEKKHFGNCSPLEVITVRVEVEPKLISWACKRSGLDIDYLERRFPKIAEWTSGKTNPTFRQLEDFAKVSHTPLGYLFLPRPPKESVPIPDLRTIGNEHIDHPSPDLLETIYICQQRQEWYQAFARSTKEKPFSFVGSLSSHNDPVQAARVIRETLGFDFEKRRHISTRTNTLKWLIQKADSIGVMVMVSGIVGNNTRRTLNPEEFRGFAIADSLAPLVFINGADTKAAQIFTLAHELVHIWLGESALSDTGLVTLPTHRVENWCNRVAAEILVPIGTLEDEYDGKTTLRNELDRLARLFKVSTLVILRRLRDIGRLTSTDFRNKYSEELNRLRRFPRGSGGDFYPTLISRVSRRFGHALVISTLEGQTLHRDALHMLGVSKLETFHELSRQLGVL